MPIPQTTYARHRPLTRDQHIANLRVPSTGLTSRSRRISSTIRATPSSFQVRKAPQPCNARRPLIEGSEVVTLQNLRVSRQLCHAVSRQFVECFQERLLDFRGSHAYHRSVAYRSVETPSRDLVLGRSWEPGIRHDRAFQATRHGY